MFKIQNSGSILLDTTTVQALAPSPYAHCTKYVKKYKILGLKYKIQSDCLHNTCSMYLGYIVSQTPT